MFAWQILCTCSRTAGCRRLHTQNRQRHHPRDKLQGQKSFSIYLFYSFILQLKTKKQNSSELRLRLSLWVTPLFDFCTVFIVFQLKFYLRICSSCSSPGYEILYHLICDPCLSPIISLYS